MIYASFTTIPSRVKNLYKSVDSLLKQTQKPDKIFINIPIKFRRFAETISDDEIPKFDNDIVEVTKCEDCGPGTKLLGSLNKLKKDSLIILVDDDNIYEDYMVEKFFYFYNQAPNNSYSFYVHPLRNMGIGQGADGFAINTNNLNNIKKFYENVVKDYKELFLYDDLWISYFLYHFKKSKILSLQKFIKKKKEERFSLIYKTHTDGLGLVSNYGKNLREAVMKRDHIALQSIKYLDEKTKNINLNNS